MPSTSRWAGVRMADRRAERRTALIRAAFDLFGTSGVSALSVRSVCRACGFNSRYFYESFRDTDELLGAVYDETAAELAVEIERQTSSGDGTVRSRTRAGIRGVLEFGSADPRRGRILFTEARANPVLAQRRAQTQDLLRELALAENRLHEADPMTSSVRAALFTGAMAELAQQWLAGNLGDDLDAVVDVALRLLLD
ncbi:regulatory protein TetR [Gordonia bronchialis DSM 43247]|uniref:Regulatory protein TetR n=1 Tax=Gordonia bronchialis (strain ATCC 25592 / DSM 43247 / BCRC 13721 / JCM 3198 / KCTC 3076 / NBRC 16047 / NCTC 10667) TaxID=526226 RepID=D0LDY8_GORB4|nr:TetR family transcriptional regulator [Gordonia bronchialis]ACY22580.1 regulatory protein TetR [Gordonia bronchialis DSM 43247]MCC3325362.1 TetR/AcrR family transcriptional regulator [Gordonia bronchialis]QGS26908.1 TetR family transcriptional regulator [Gordonia bronchialis]